MVELGKNPNKPNTVTVYCDPVPNSDKYSDHSTSSVDLLPTKWNKDKDKAWRLDIDVTLMTAKDDDNDVESDDEIASSDESEDESEGGSDNDESEYSEEE